MTTNLAVNLKSRVGCTNCGTSPELGARMAVGAAVGARWVRSSRPMQMEIVSTGPRAYDFANNGEAVIDAAVANGLSIMGILDGRWGNETLFNKLPYASPIWEHLDLWEDFAGAVVRYYKDRVKYWEILNEPPFFWWYPTPDGVTIPAVKADLHRAPIWAYAALLKASARAIRAADPEAKIVLGSGFPDGLFLERLYELGCREHFDIASVHYLNCRHPEDFARGYRRVRAVMKRFGDADKPLWDTESGPGGAVIGQAVQTPLEYESLYNIYRHCFAHEFGLDRYFWFSAPKGFCAADGSLWPASTALKTLIDRTGDGSLLGAAHPGGEVHVYVFDGPRGAVSILWATAPATARLGGEAAEVTDHLGRPVSLADTFALTGRPLFISGDIRNRLDVTVTGRRETVVSSKKTPPAATPEFACPRAGTDGRLDIHDAAWDRIPYMATRAEIPVTEQAGHFCMLSSSVAADVKMAYGDDALTLRVKTYDDRLNPDLPTGLIQFSLRDSNPDVGEWAYFYNAYGLFNLFASKHGPMFLRYEHLLPDEYPGGVIPEAEVKIEAEPDGLLWWARVPWSVLGPCRPGQHNPFLMMFTFNRADHLLDVPESDTPEEWSHNFGDTFIVKPPALTRWVRFM